MLLENTVSGYLSLDGNDSLNHYSLTARLHSRQSGSSRSASPSRRSRLVLNLGNSIRVQESGDVLSMSYYEVGDRSVSVGQMLTIEVSIQGLNSGLQDPC